MPNIDVTVASTDVYLTTTAAVKAALGLGSTTTSADSAIDSSILQASAWAAGVIGYPLTLATYREVVPSFGTRSLTLARTPVRAVKLLFNTTSTDDGTQVETTDFQLNAGAGLIRRPTGWAWSVPTESYLTLRPLPGQEYPDWMVDYVAGWTYAGLSTDSSNWSTEKGTTSTGRTLPYDIESAVVAKAVGIYLDNEDVVEEKVGDLMVKYGAEFGTGHPSSSATEALMRYARTL